MKLCLVIIVMSGTLHADDQPLWWQQMNEAAIAGSSTRPVRSTFHSSHGAVVGRTTTTRTDTRFYSAHGAYEGRAVRVGPTIRYFNAKGRYIGSRR